MDIWKRKNLYTKVNEVTEKNKLNFSVSHPYGNQEMGKIILPTWSLKEKKHGYWHFLYIYVEKRAGCYLLGHCTAKQIFFHGKNCYFVRQWKNWLMFSRLAKLYLLLSPIWCFRPVFPCMFEHKARFWWRLWKKSLTFEIPNWIVCNLLKP